MAILDWIYPKKCLECGDVGRYVCTACQRGIQRKGESLKYTGIVRKVIKEIKYRGSYDLVHELVELWAPRRPAGDVLVTSVPMWAGKKRVRGYNQAELIAREVARIWKVRYQELLVRNRDTKPMYGLDKSARIENINGAFTAKSRIFTNNTIVLIDDVWTSGATILECARVLKKSGVKKIILLALAS
jgi:competence protein ComFC